MIDSLPPAEAFEHGTRARYVKGCRCDDCRASNTRRAAERARAARAAAATVKPNRKPATTVFHRTRPDGTRYEVMARACPGTGGHPCVAGGAWLRGAGPVCRKCVERATVWDGLVPSARARRHLRKLSLAGVGYKAVHDASDVATSTLQEIICGASRQIRASVERRILAVDVAARADRALIPAAPTWALIEDLVARGFTRRWISTELGHDWYAPVLQKRRDLVTARNAAEVERLHRRIVEQGVTPPTTAWVPGAPVYALLATVLERVPRTPLSRYLGYTIQAVPPARVRATTAERIRRFAAELERRRLEGDPLPDDWHTRKSPVVEAFGYEGGWQRGRVEGKRARANAKAREAQEIRDLLAGEPRRRVG